MKKKVWLMALTVILLLAITACGKVKETEVSNSRWDKYSIANVLPYPEKGTLDIMSDDKDNFYASLEDVSEEYYEEYLAKVEESGFTIDVEKNTTSYTAYNEDGYKLNLICFGESISLDLEPPKVFTELRWPTSDVGQLTPTPKSTVGKIEWEASYGFSIYVGETSFDEYKDYVNECMDMGFVKDYAYDDDYFYANNEAGYYLSVKYEGNHTMSVKIDAPLGVETEDSEVTTAATTEESVEKTVEKKSDIDSDLKAFLDEYESFMYDYIDFIEKYENSDDMLSMANDYTKMITKYAEFIDALDDYDTDKMSASDAAYYLEVTNRVNQKMLESM